MPRTVKGTKEYSSIQPDTAVKDTNNVFVNVAGGRYVLAAPTLTDGQFYSLRLSADGTLMVDTELTLDGNVIIDNVAVWATTIADSSTAGFALIDADGHPQVDVLTLPGGLTGYEEDTQHTTADIGVLNLAVRNDVLAALCNTDGDYVASQVDADGALYVDLSNVLGATMSATNPVFTELTDGTAVVSAANPLNTQIGDGTNQAAIIATILALKTDLSSVAGTATDVDAGNASVGSQRVVLATDDINAAAIKLATEASQTALEIIDDWDESDRAKVNLIAGQAGVAAGSGAVDALTPRVILATDDPAVTSLAIMDDWDETNRCAVNLIAGQVGIAGGAGAVAATVPRVTLASDDPLVAKLDVAQLGAGSQALVNTSITTPSGYAGETMSQWNRVGQVTCTLADRVYDIIVPVAVQDGTNQLCLVELQLLQTGWTAPAAGAATAEVRVYRENTANGNAAATAAVEEINMISESKILLPVINDWGLTKIKIASSTAGAVFNIEAKGVYFTP